MTDKVTVFDSAGQKLGELPGVIIQRMKKAERSIDSAGGSFSVSATETVANLNLLQYLRFVLVQSDQQGVEDWCGVIWDDDNGITVNGGEIRIILKECTYLLSAAYTGEIETILSPSTPGAIFFYLLYVAAQRNSTLSIVSRDNSRIDMTTGASSSPVYNKASIYEIANQLASDGDFFWWFTPKRDPITDNLQLIPVWRTKTGSNYSGQLVESSTEISDATTGANSGGNFAVSSYAEKTRPGFQFATRVQAYGKFDDWKAPLESDWQINSVLESDIGGIVQWVEPSIQSTTKDQLNDAAKHALKNRTPRLYITGIVTASPYPLLGDTCPVVLTDNGSFLQDKRGSLLSMRVLTTVYAPDGSGLVIYLEEVLRGE